MNNSNSLNFIDDCLKILGYEKDENSSKSEENNNEENRCKNFNSDTPNGFQDVDPFFFLVTAEVMGDVIAGLLPFNTANQVSCIINMVGQIIETYAAQIAYFEGGPGALYNPENRNIANRFCKENEALEGADTEEVDNLKCEIKKLRNELKSMQERIEILEGRSDE